MTVTSVVPDRDALTLTLTASYTAPVEAVWQLWADPRRLERWWGPPTYPATVLEHDLRSGGRVRYSMTGPDGAGFPGWWNIADVTPPTGLVFDDGFGDPDAPSDMPVTRTSVTIADAGDGTTTMVLLSSFPTRDALEKLLAMGMQEGLTEAVGQTDAILAALPAR